MHPPKITIVRHLSASGAKVRLLCFPHIAGGPASFNSWRRQLSAEVELCVPLLPGREHAFNAPPFVEVDPLLDALERAIGPLLDMPMVFFGDCLGALIAGMTANTLERRGNRSIEKVIMRSLPYSPTGPNIPGLPKSAASANELADYLRNVGKTDPKLLDDPDWVDVITQPLRGDLALTESLRGRSVETISAPLTVIADRHSPCGIEGFMGWADLTRSEFVLRIQEDRFLNEDQLWRRVAKSVDEEVRGLIT
ncbi:thioesterase domain-containing protein [Nonomuraea sp. NPDC050643]|uniref:thioesterase II family protein n=1 Tax=Nonomuraea sp. NPDC050643 TaxID=3155660 RepID=UPI0033DC9074